MVPILAGAVALVNVIFPTSPDPRSLVITPAVAAHAQTLVQKLGSDVFTERDDASRQLRTMGRHALPALKGAIKSHPDPEVRLRCEFLVAPAAAEDFSARLATFLADTDGRFEHDLPGWSRFRAMTDNDPEARGLFATMLRSEANRYILAGMAQERGELLRRVAARRQELYTRMYPRSSASTERYDPSLGDVATLFFCDTIIGDSQAPAVGIGVRVIQLSMLVSRANLRNNLSNDRFGPATLKIISAWIDSRETPTGLTQGLSMCTQFNLKEQGLACAIRLVRHEGAAVTQRGTGIVALGRYGSKKEAALLLNHLADDSILRTEAGGYPEVQVRDLALAMAAQLAGHDPTDLGIYLLSKDEYSRYYYWNYVFRTDEDRKKGFAKWAELEPTLQPKKKAMD